MKILILLRAILVTVLFPFTVIILGPTSILLHFLFNGVQVLALYIITITGVKGKKDLEESFPIWAGAIALALLFYIFTLYKKTSAIELTKYEEDVIEDDTAWTKIKP